MASGTGTPIRALVVEYSTAGRGRIVRVLEADGDICVVGEASTGAEAIRLVHDLRPDIVTLGLSLPDTTGRDTIEQIVAQGVESGEFRTPYPADAARSILSLCAAIAAWYRPDGRLSRGQLAEQHARYALALVEAPLPRHD